MSGGLTPCRQLRPSSRREHVRASNSQIGLKKRKKRKKQNLSNYQTTHKSLSYVVNKYLNITVARGNGDPDGRYFILDFSLKGQDFRFVNIYLPNMVRERCLLLQELYNVLTSNRVTLLGGGF